MRKQRHLILYSILFVFFLFPFPTGNTHQAAIPGTTTVTYFSHYLASPDKADQPSLQNFIETVKNSDTTVPVGVYLPDLFAVLILQQPPNQAAFVSTAQDVVTQFRIANTYHTIGLLAHNNLTGAKFSQIALNQSVFIVYGDGKTKEYKVSSIKQFQALQPESPYSEFINLEKPEKRLSSTQLFNEIYTKGDRVVFQTCLAKDGNASWGRVFITALPVPPPTDLGISPDFLDQLLLRISHKIASGS